MTCNGWRRVLSMRMRNLGVLVLASVVAGGLAGCHPTAADGWGNLAIRRDSDTMLLMVCDRLNVESLSVSETLTNTDVVDLWSVDSVGPLGPAEVVSQELLLGANASATQEPTMDAGTTITVIIRQTDKPSSVALIARLSEPLPSDTWLTPQGDLTSTPCR